MINILCIYLEEIIHNVIASKHIFLFIKFARTCEKSFKWKHNVE